MEPATPLTENKIFEQKCSTVIKENANEYICFKLWNKW